MGVSFMLLTLGTIVYQHGFGYIMNVARESKATILQLLVLLFWIICPLGLLSLAMYGMYAMEKFVNILFFVLYVASVVWLGVLAAKARVLHWRIPETVPSILFPNRLLAVALLLATILLFVGFRASLRGYDGTVDISNITEWKLRYAVVSGLQVCFFLVVIPFLAGYLPVNAISIVRKWRVQA
jgi:hypothetical protein